MAIGLRWACVLRHPLRLDGRPELGMPLPFDFDGQHILVAARHPYVCPLVVDVVALGLTIDLKRLKACAQKRDECVPAAVFAFVLVR